MTFSFAWESSLKLPVPQGYLSLRLIWSREHNLLWERRTRSHRVPVFSGFCVPVPCLCFWNYLYSLILVRTLVCEISVLARQLFSLQWDRCLSVRLVLHHCHVRWQVTSGMGLHIYSSEGNGKLLKAMIVLIFNVQEVLMKNTRFSTGQLAPNIQPFYDFRFFQTTILRTVLWFEEVILCCCSYSSLCIL